MYQLYLNQEVQMGFSPKPMILFCSSRKLRSYQVRVKLNYMQRVIGSCRCDGERCQACSNITEIDTFFSTVEHKTYKINHKLDCIEKSVFYVLTCKICSKQYGESSTGSFRLDGTSAKVTAENMSKVIPITNNIYLSTLIVNDKMFLSDV